MERAWNYFLSVKKRKEDLLRWMSEFFDYEILSGKPVRIQIKEIYGDYKPLPRKGYDSKETHKRKRIMKPSLLRRWVLNLNQTVSRRLPEMRLMILVLKNMA